MAEHVSGINPDILKWARERSGYTVETIANALSKQISIVNDWESGERADLYSA
jgi:ribosome-binding protein aMBF1 (putative translation factor)